VGSFESDRSNRQSGQSTATAEASSELGTVDVEIQGRSLSVRSDRDPEFVRQLANHVDDTLGELKRAAPSASTEKILMMASLTVAEELFEARREVEDLRQEIADRTDVMQNLLSHLEEQV
jgi:cell division protein ZapA